MADLSPNPSPSPDSEFVTIAEAARRLGISERQVRRDVRTLPDTDRRTSGKGPARVRLSALIDLRGITVSEAKEEKPTPDIDRQAPSSVQNTPENAGQSGHGEGALVDQLRADLLQARADLEHERTQRQADVERWSKAHDQSQQLHLASVAEVQRLQQRTAELEAQNARLIEAIPIVETAAESVTVTTPQSTPQNSVENSAATEQDQQQTVIATEAKQEPATDTTPRKRGFWNLFGRRG